MSSFNQFGPTEDNDSDPHNLGKQREESLLVANEANLQSNFGDIINSAVSEIILYVDKTAGTPVLAMGDLNVRNAVVSALLATVERLAEQSK
jgi:hypothetical protein